MPGPRDCNSCSWIHGMMLGCRTDSASRQPSIQGKAKKKEGGPGPATRVANLDVKRIVDGWSWWFSGARDGAQAKSDTRRGRALATSELQAG